MTGIKQMQWLIQSSGYERHRNMLCGWPSVMIRLGPHWHTVKIKMNLFILSLVVAMLDVSK